MLLFCVVDVEKSNLNTDNSCIEKYWHNIHFIYLIVLNNIQFIFSSNEHIWRMTAVEEEVLEFIW